MEQELASLAEGQAVSELDLQQSRNRGGLAPVFRPADVSDSLRRLSRAGRALSTNQGGVKRYYLSASARGETEALVRTSATTVSNVLKELFGRTCPDPESFREAFIRVGCHVFSELSNIYVRVLCRLDLPERIAGHRLLSSSIDEAVRTCGVKDKALFRQGLDRFFRESTAEFDTIKWNLAQNHYLLRVLGLDEGARLLTRDVLHGARFVLDTNVLLAGLDPAHRHHGSLSALGAAFDALGVGTIVLGPTVHELQGVLSSNISDLRELYQKVPRGLVGRVRGFMVEAYVAALQEEPALEISDFIRRFDAPFHRLDDLLKIQHIDEPWFDRAANDRKTQSLARKLSSRYQSVRGRTKGDAAAIHDALVLRWIVEQRPSSGVSLLSLDSSLPGVQCEELGNAVAPVVGLDALLQWTGSVGLDMADGDGLASLFSQVVALEFFPKSSVLSLRDFRVFADMEIETAQVPSEDVEACLGEIRQLGPVDFSKPEGRERAARVVQRHFTDPGTKLSRELEHLRGRDADLERQFGAERERASQLEKIAGRAEREAEAARQVATAAEGKAEQERVARGVAEKHAAALSAQLRLKEEAESQRKLAASTRGWLIVGSTLLLLLWVGIGYIAINHGEGTSWFVRVTRAWPWFGGAAAGVGIAVRFALGKERRAVVTAWFGAGQ